MSDFDQFKHIIESLDEVEERNLREESDRLIKRFCPTFLNDTIMKGLEYVDDEDMKMKYLLADFLETYNISINREFDSEDNDNDKEIISILEDHLKDLVSHFELLAIRKSGIGLNGVTLRFTNNQSTVLNSVNKPEIKSHNFTMPTSENKPRRYGRRNLFSEL